MFFASVTVHVEPTAKRDHAPEISGDGFEKLEVLEVNAIGFIV